MFAAGGFVDYTAALPGLLSSTINLRALSLGDTDLDSYKTHDISSALPEFLKYAELDSVYLFAGIVGGLIFL